MANATTEVRYFIGPSSKSDTDTPDNRHSHRQSGAPCVTLWHEPVGQGSVVPKHEQSELVAHAGGTSTQTEGSGPASGGSLTPEHSCTHTCVGVHSAVSQVVDGRTLVSHFPALQ
jgi:hypothetical protein